MTQEMTMEMRMEPVNVKEFLNETERDLLQIIYDVADYEKTLNRTDIKDKLVEIVDKFHAIKGLFPETFLDKLDEFLVNQGCDIQQCEGCQFNVEGCTHSLHPGVNP